MDRPVFKVALFAECVVLISGIGMAPPSGMGGSETSEYSLLKQKKLKDIPGIESAQINGLLIKTRNGSR